MLRFLTAGESHGATEVAILEGIPAGLLLTREEIQKDLDKRRGGAGRGGRVFIEKDQVKIISGVRHGKTLGSPIALSVDNADFSNWKGMMAVEPQNHLGGGRIVTNPRPGHADLAGAQKYGFSDIRNVLERASARETIMRVAVGAVCRKLLAEIGIEIASHTIQIGMVKLIRVGPFQSPTLFNSVKQVYENDPEIRCIDQVVSKQMAEEIDRARRSKNTLGGIVETIAHNVPVGLGSYVHWDRKLDGRLAQALMSIHSVKAVEIGDGVINSELFGSQVHDAIHYKKKFYRKTNLAGGLEGGVTNGEDIICRVYHKPISTLGNPLDTVDIKTKQKTKALIERSDICVVPRAGVISEAMIAYVLADASLEKFGGDSIVEFKRNFIGYMKQISHF